MKKYILFSLFALILCVPFSAGEVAQKDASALRPAEERKVIARGLYGRIEIVNAPAAANYCVYITDITAEADLRVEIVDTFANSPGKWEIVDGAPNFRVYFVKSPAEADIMVYLTKHFPGPTR